MKIESDVAVIGAGAAGMIAAGFAASRGLNTVLIERNRRPGRKIMITGKGRCNLTNACGKDEFISSVPCGGKFLYGAFSRFSADDVMAFFENRGVPLKIERGRRVFPVSDKSSDIVDALYGFCLEKGCRFINTRARGLIIKDGAAAGATLEDGREIAARAVIISTGGKSYPLTGSTGDGYDFAAQAGHTVITPRPSLVPIETVEDWPQKAMGLSLRNVTLEVKNLKSGKTVFSKLGEMLFTHFGVTGPLILSASALMRDNAALESGSYKLYIDLKPALTHEKLDLRVRRELLQNSNKDFINVMQGLLPSKFIPVFAQLSEIPEHTKANQITKEQRMHAVSLLKKIELTAKCFRPVEEAVITSGGVALNEINPSSMESKLVKGLYFAGEVIDADAFTGGYNLQIAFSTGHEAGMSVCAE